MILKWYFILTLPKFGIFNLSMSALCTGLVFTLRSMQILTDKMEKITFFANDNNFHNQAFVSLIAKTFLKQF